MKKNIIAGLVLVIMSMTIFIGCEFAKGGMTTTTYGTVSGESWTVTKTERDANGKVVSVEEDEITDEEFEEEFEKEIME